LAREAIAADRDDAVTLRYAGMCLALAGRDYDAAAAALDRAVMINPNSAEVRAAAGWIQNFIGNGAAAIDHLHRALRWSPLDPERYLVLAALGSAYTLTGAYEEAIAWARQATHEKPTWIAGYRVLISPLVFLGRIEEAVEVGKAVMRLDPKMSIAGLRRVLPFRDPAYAERILDALRQAGIPEQSGP